MLKNFIGGEDNDAVYRIYGMKDKAAFLEESTKQLTLLFKMIKAGKKPPADMKYRSEGFIHAGIFMGIASRQEMQELMEAAHHRVFGLTIAERQQKMAGKWSNEQTDYSVLDIPTVIRRKGESSAEN